MQAKGELHLEVTYKPFEDDDTDSGYREAEAYALLLQQQAITDVKVIPPGLLFHGSQSPAGLPTFVCRGTGLQAGPLQGGRKGQCVKLFVLKGLPLCCMAFLGTLVEAQTC